LIIAIYFTSLKCQILFGGKEIENHEIPDEYGAIEPTAVFVPLKEVR
jgi:1-pyrroline-5-carboxylate dehydrogenase